MKRRRALKEKRAIALEEKKESIEIEYVVRVAVDKSLDKDGLAYFINRFKPFDGLLNKKVKVFNPQEQIGVAKGIDNTGHLLVQTNEQLMSILSDDIIILE